MKISRPLPVTGLAIGTTLGVVWNKGRTVLSNATERQTAKCARPLGYALGVRERGSSDPKIVKLARRLSVILIVGVVVFSPISGRTNMAGIVFHGGNPQLGSPHKNIRMESERVIIRLKRSSYTVDAVFHFFNAGSRTTQWVGFPKFYRGCYEEPIDFLRFDAWVNGRKASFSEESRLFRDPRATPDKNLPHAKQSYARWIVKQITFPGHGKTTIRIRYEAVYFRMGSVLYSIGTGRNWKGNIGKAVFIIDGTDIGGTKNLYTALTPNSGPMRISQNIVMYEIADFEPDRREELQIDYRGG